jgi:hypothetical protein
MTLPSAYLTSFKNVEGIFQAIQAAQAPARFTQKFLESLGFPNANDRQTINVLKSLGFLDDTGVPTRRYHEYLDQSQSGVILADGVREAYADLFRVNKSANDMSTADVKNKMKTLSEGQFTDRVLTQMSGTFSALTKLADFAKAGERFENSAVAEDPEVQQQSAPTPRATLNGLVYNINIHLPESRDQAVYDALFRSLKEHLT